MTKKKIIIISASSVLAAALVATELAIPLASYTSFRTRKDEVIDAVVTRDASTLKSIKAEWKDGVEFFDNGLASPDADDLVVKAKYGGKYAEAKYVTLDASEFTLTSAPDFTTNGGKVSVSYMGKLAELTAELTPLEVTEVRIAENPYLVAYAENSVFDPDGMVVEASYNDGIVREVTNYSYPTHALESGTRGIECSFTFGEQTFPFTVPIRVEKELNDGKIVKLISAEKDYSVEDGNTLASAKIIGEYASGNRRLLSSDMYFLDADKTAALGKRYNATAMLKSDIGVNVDLSVRVSKKTECENATAIGISKITAQIDEMSYDRISGNFASVGNKVTVVEETTANFKTKIGNYSTDVNKGLLFDVETENACYGDIVLRTTNAKWSGGSKGQRNLEQYCFDDVYSYIVNGQKIHIAESVIVPSVITKGEIDQSDSDTAAWNNTRSVFFDVRVKHVRFKQGKNRIMLKLDVKNNHAVNAWNEIGGERMDSFRVETYGDPQDDPHTIVGDTVAATQPDCTHGGAAEHRVCAECGNMVDENGNNIFAAPALGHDWSGYDVTENEHILTCSRCDLTIANEHEFTLLHDDRCHWQGCICGAVKDKAEHSYDVDIVCRDKDYAQQYTAADFDISGLCACGDRLVDTKKTDLEIIENKPANDFASTVKVTYKGVEYTFNPITKIEAENTSLCQKSEGLSVQDKKASERREDGNCYYIEPVKIVRCVQDFKTKDVNWKNATDGKWSDSHTERSITITVNVTKAGKYKIGASMTNFMCLYGNMTEMGEVQLNDYFALYVDNSGESHIPDATKLEACKKTTDNDTMWHWFNDADLGTYDLTVGEHTFKFMLDVKPGKPGNCWDEYGDLKVDYFTFEFAE